MIVLKILTLISPDLDTVLFSYIFLVYGVDFLLFFIP